VTCSDLLHQLHTLFQSLRPSDFELSTTEEGEFWNESWKMLTDISSHGVEISMGGEGGGGREGGREGRDWKMSS